MSELTTRQRERLQLLGRVIQAHEDNFDMQHWSRYIDELARPHAGDVADVLDTDLEACGSSACLAGWGYAIFHKEIDEYDNSMWFETLQSKTMRFLGLPKNFMYRIEWSNYYKYVAQEASEALAASMMLFDYASGAYAHRSMLSMEQAAGIFDGRNISVNESR